MLEASAFPEHEVGSALSDLAEADMCTVKPGDERRPRRYAVEHSSPTRA